MPQKFHTSQDMAIPPFTPLKPTLSWQILMNRPYLTDVKQRVEINEIEKECGFPQSLLVALLHV